MRDTGTLKPVKPGGRTEQVDPKLGDRILHHIMKIEEEKSLQIYELENPTHFQFSREDIIYRRGII